MRVAKLVNEPNITHQGAKVADQSYAKHGWCHRWSSTQDKATYREPLFVRVDKGPIHCELCGRRVSRLLRRILLKNCMAAGYDEVVNDGETPVRVTYFHFRREKKGKTVSMWSLLQELSEEVF